MVFCNVCEQPIVNYRSHKKTKKHKYNWLGKFNKVRMLPVDLQRIIGQYIYYYGYRVTPLFRPLITEERNKMVMNCWWNCRKFYDDMLMTYKFERFLFLAQLRVAMCKEDMLLDKKNHPSWYINGYYLCTTKPIADYMRAMNENTWGVDEMMRYATHKYPIR